jgi:hypothetical protein
MNILFLFFIGIKKLGGKKKKTGKGKGKCSLLLKRGFFFFPDSNSAHILS